MRHHLLVAAGANTARDEPTPFGAMNLPTVSFTDLKGTVLAKDHLPGEMPDIPQGTNA